MPTLTCPICRKLVRFTSRDEVPWRPFCSRHCKLVDLGRWLNEEYRISEDREDFEDGPDPDGNGPAENA